MGRQRHGAEQIIAKLREAEVELARGKTAGEVCRKLGVTEQTYYLGHYPGGHPEGGPAAPAWAAHGDRPRPGRAGSAGRRAHPSAGGGRFGHRHLTCAAEVTRRGR